jgi:hypothetical protein
VRRDLERDDELLPVVPYVPFRCPICGAGKPDHKGRGRRPGLRYHQCRCGAAYHSQELRPSEITAWSGREHERPPVVPFVPFLCPRCAANRPFTYGVKGCLRYHRCQGCSIRYRSFEVAREDMHRWRAASSGADAAALP